MWLQRTWLSGGLSDVPVTKQVLLLQQEIHAAVGQMLENFNFRTVVYDPTFGVNAEFCTLQNTRDSCGFVLIPHICD